MIHKFVKTTPKPSATKNSKGELELPWLLFCGGWLVDAGGVADAVFVVGTSLDEDKVPPVVGEGAGVSLGAIEEEAT